MLDSVLVEHVMGIHRQKLTGVLLATGAMTTMRFAFQNGDPVAIDFGRAKDLLLADTLLAYHRLTEPQYAEAAAQFNAGKASILQFVTSQRFATPQEVALGTQAMVEDSLCQCFSTGSMQLEFVADAGTEDFDFAKQAMRLKIPADLLLRTTSARVAENLSLVEEFKDFTGVYALSESEAESGSLTDAEKRVLNAIDGRITVRDIAAGVRDSVLNVARIIRALHAKRILKRISQTTRIVNSNTTMNVPPRGTGSATTEVDSTGVDRRSGPAQEIADFTPFRHEPQPSGSRSTTIVLGAVLVTMFGIGALVLRANAQNREIQEATDRLSELLSHSDWNGALGQLATAQVKAGTDLDAQQRVAKLDGLIKAALANEAKAVRTFAAAGDFAQARTRWALLPSGPVTDALRTEIDSAETSFEERKKLVADQVRQQLAEEKPEEALKTLGLPRGGDKVPDRVLELAAKELENWQLGQLDLIQGATTPLWRKLELVALVRRSDPAAHELKLLESAAAALSERKTQIAAMVAPLRQRIGQGGDMLVLLAEIDRLRAETAKTPLEEPFVALRAEVESVRGTTEEFQARAVAAIRTIDSADGLKAVAATSDQIVPPGTPVPDTLLGQLVGVVRGVVATTALEGSEVQAKALQAVLTGHDLPAPVVAAVNVRIDQLNNLERTCTGLLETARTLAREGDLTAAQHLLRSILDRDDLKATASRAQADPELVTVEARIARRKDLEAQLKDVITRGDLGAGTALAREMGLRYLPLAIDTVPTGAQVWKDGQQLGVTPLVLEMAAADRVDQTFELRVPGYTTRQVTGAEAEAGWRLVVALERQPTVSTSLKGAVTSQPAILGDRLVVADRSNLRILDAAGAVTSVAFKDAAVEQPIYAPASLAGKSIVLTTRDRFGLKIVGDEAARFPLAAGSDFPFVSYQSQVIVDRHYVVVAALEGRLQAVDVLNPRSRWSGPGGAPFAAAPVLAVDRFRTVRTDGVLEELIADNGQVSIATTLGAPVIAAWPQGPGYAGCTATEAWTWDGTVIQRDPLPQTAQWAGPGILVSTNSRVWVQKGGTWKEIRRTDLAPTQPPQVWGDHIVIVAGKQVQVTGPRGFTATFAADVLPPVVWNHRLVLVAQDGAVRMYDP